MSETCMPSRVPGAALSVRLRDKWRRMFALGKQGDCIRFRCNICDTENTQEAAAFHREKPNCVGCGSTPRFRGLALALSEGLFGRALPLSAMPAAPHIHGLGMSDWEPLVERLEAKFTHTNTYFHAEPRYDVMSGEPSSLSNFDYVICSEVFEHVVPPLERGFNNLRKLLKPGGKLIFSTPYTAAPETTEHFPGMRDFRLCEFDGQWVLVAKDVEGRLKLYDNLVFHGGPGTVVEMRVWAESHLFRLLKEAGFIDVRPLSAPMFDFGYYWPVRVERAEIGYPSLDYIIVATAQ